MPDQNITTLTAERKSMLDKLGDAYRALRAIGNPKDTAHAESLMGRMNDIVRLDSELTEYAQSAAGIKVES